MESAAAAAAAAAAARSMDNANRADPG